MTVISDTKVEDKDLGFNAIIKQIKKLEGSETDIGLWGDGEPDSNLAARAAIHEYGSASGKIPSRPYNRKAFDKNLKRIKEVITKLYDVMLLRRITAKKLLGQLGDWYTGVLKDSITFGKFKALKPATIKAKGSTRTLIDTADMRNRTTHKEKMG